MKQNERYGTRAMKQALEPYAAREIREIGRTGDMEYEYSVQAMEKIHGIIAAHRIRRTVRPGRRIGVGILAAVMLAGVTCGAVEPIREKIANAFLYRELRGDEEMVLIDFDGTASDGEKSETALYIPDGFEAAEKRVGESSITCDYKNSDGDWFYVSRQAYNEWDDMQYAYREGTFLPESVVKDDREYLLLRPAADGTTHAVMWAADGYAFCIETTLTESEMMKIADSITADCEIFAD